MRSQSRLGRICPRGADRVAALLFSLMVISCSGGVPSESDAKDAFTSRYQKEIDQGLVTLDAFSKVNAQRMDMFGVSLYTVEYRATIAWPKGLNTQCIGNDPDEFRGWDCAMAKSRKVGQVENLAGTLEFEKTENGWRGPGGKVY